MPPRKPKTRRNFLDSWSVIIAPIGRMPRSAFDQEPKLKQCQLLSEQQRIQQNTGRTTNKRHVARRNRCLKLLRKAGLLGTKDLGRAGHAARGGTADRDREDVDAIDRALEESQDLFCIHFNNYFAVGVAGIIAG